MIAIFIVMLIGMKICTIQIDLEIWDANSGLQAMVLILENTNQIVENGFGNTPWLEESMWKCRPRYDVLNDNINLMYVIEQI